MTKTREPRFSMEQVDGRNLRVAHWKAESKTDKLPLLFFNGIGANIEAMAPLAHMLPDRDFLTFDMPGVGGSPEPMVPYNAWGGAMAQQFTLQNGPRVNRLILAATTAGMLMVPGNPKALIKMADPRRYIDPDFMRKHFNTLYGGTDDGSEGHIGRIKPPSKTGYFYQLLAMLGWTSAPFLPFMKHDTLIMMGGDDQIVPVANGHFLKMLIPNSELFIIDDGGHLFMLSHVEESITAMREFLDRPKVGKKQAA
jgi:pimeloyl-ACP methyl ester carboxylesterase